MYKPWDPADNFSSRGLREGTVNANLSWQFNLTELKFVFLGLLFDGKPLAGAKPSGQQLQPGFEKQLGIGWILKQTFVRLIIFNVTIKENGTFTFQVDAKPEKGFWDFRFKSNVQVNAVGKLKVKSRKIYIYIYIYI